MTAGAPRRRFCDDLVAQVRAADAYGRLDRFGTEALLRPFLVAQQAPDEIALPCVADPAAVERLRAFVRAVAAGVERETGLGTTCVLDHDVEGFARAVVFVGRLVVLSEAVRDLNTFGFRSLDHIAEWGTALVRSAVETAGAFPKEVTHAEP